MSNRTSASGSTGQPIDTAPLGRGFASPGQDAQTTFRSVMMALAQPGTIHDVSKPVDACPGLSPAMTAVALTLLDFETSVWLDAGSPAAAYLSFHTGASIVSSPAAATFALVTRPADMPDVASFCQGSLDYPDTSTTILIDVETLVESGGWTLSGPGIPSTRNLSIAPLRVEARGQILSNRRLFPCGVDFVFCQDARIAALPRSTRVAIAREG